MAASMPRLDARQATLPRVRPVTRRPARAHRLAALGFPSRTSAADDEPQSPAGADARPGVR